jgi:hypothetical protein
MIASVRTAPACSTTGVPEPSPEAKTERSREEENGSLTTIVVQARHRQTPSSRARSRPSRNGSDRRFQRRRKLSPLPAFWHTEVSPLNRVIDVRAYDSFEDRTRIRAASQKLEGHIGRSRSHRPLYYRRSPELGPVQRRAVNPGQEMADGDDRPLHVPDIRDATIGAGNHDWRLHGLIPSKSRCCAPRRKGR